MAEPAPVTAEDLRERLRETARAAFASRKLPDGSYAIYSDRNPWRALDDAVDAVMAALAGDPGDLPARMAAEMRRAFKQWIKLDGKTNSHEVGEHLAAAAMGVRDEQLIHETARAVYAEGQMSALREHGTRWETEKARADKAERQARGYRGMKDVYLRERNAAHADLIKAEEIIERLCDDRGAGQQVVKAAITEQRERAEKAEAEVERLRAELNQRRIDAERDVCSGCMQREVQRDKWAEASRQNGIKAERYEQAWYREKGRAEQADAEVARLSKELGEWKRAHERTFHRLLDSEAERGN